MSQGDSLSSFVMMLLNYEEGLVLFTVLWSSFFYLTDYFFHKKRLVMLYNWAIFVMCFSHFLTSALWKESPPFHCWFLRNVWSVFTQYWFIYYESSAIPKKWKLNTQKRSLKKCIYLFFGEKKLYTVGCFPIWRKGAVLHSVNQKSGFSNLTLEEAFIDLFMEDSVLIHMFESRFFCSFTIKCIKCMQLLRRQVRNAWLIPRDLCLEDLLVHTCIIHIISIKKSLHLIAKNRSWKTFNMSLMSTVGLF